MEIGPLRTATRTKMKLTNQVLSIFGFKTDNVKIEGEKKISTTMRMISNMVT